MGVRGSRSYKIAYSREKTTPSLSTNLNGSPSGEIKKICEDQAIGLVLTRIDTDHFDTIIDGEKRVQGSTPGRKSVT